MTERLGLHRDDTRKSYFKSMWNQNWLFIFFINAVCPIVPDSSVHIIQIFYQNAIIFSAFELMILQTESTMCGKEKNIDQLTDQPELWKTHCSDARVLPRGCYEFAKAF